MMLVDKDIDKKDFLKKRGRNARIAEAITIFREEACTTEDLEP